MITYTSLLLFIKLAASVGFGWGFRVGMIVKRSGALMDMEDGRIS